MAIEIKAPTFPESVADGTVATWHKQPGDAVKRDELLVDIETDKVVMEVLAEADGVMGDIAKAEGDTVLSGEVLGVLKDGEAAAAPAAKPAEAKAESAPAAAEATGEEPMLSPAARKLAEENGLVASEISGTGKGGRVTKEDVLNAVEAKKNAPAAKPAAPAAPAAAVALPEGDRTEKRVPMTRLRARIAERLVDAQSNMAMLTTFNEVNMKPVMDLRSKYKDLFEKKHNGVRLGFMSFFVKAATEALKRFPAVNASTSRAMEAQAPSSGKMTTSNKPSSSSASGAMGSPPPALLPLQIQTPSASPVHCCPSHRTVSVVAFHDPSC